MTFQRGIIDIKGLSEIEGLDSDEEGGVESFVCEDQNQSTCHSSSVLRRESSPLTISTTTSANRDTGGSHIGCQETMILPPTTNNQKTVDGFPKTPSTVAGVSLNTITFCLPSLPCLLAGENKRSNHKKTSCEPDNYLPECSNSNFPLSTNLVNTIVTSSSESNLPSSTKSLCSTEFAELLKSCKITIKPVKKSENKKASCKSLYSSARWRYLTNQTRTKPHRLKWHHTNFDDKSKKSRKSLPKSVLSDTTPLAQAWLEQATRDRATAETLRTVESHVYTHISPSNDPCLVSASYLSDGEIDLPDIDISNAAKTCDDHRSGKSDLFHNPEGSCDDESCETEVRDLKEQCQRYRKRRDEHEKDVFDTKQWKKRWISADPVDANEPKVPQEESEDCSAESFKMKGELSCFSPQKPETFQIEQQIWNPCPNSVGSSTDNLLVDLFGEPSEFFNVDSVNDIIMDDNFSLFDMESNSITEWSSASPQEKPFLVQQINSTVPPDPCMTSYTANSVCSLASISHPSPNPPQSIYKPVARSSSFDHPGCPPEELFCTSDTDSGIHSPGAAKSPPDDVYNWKTDLNCHDMEVFFHHPVTSQSTIDSEEMASVGMSSGVQEPQLLNMDDHQRYNAVPLKSIFSRDSSSCDTSSRDNENRSPRTEDLKFDCISKGEEWSTLLSADKAATSGNFQITYAPSSPTSSTATQRRPKKVLKRRSHSGKSRKSSEKGKSSPHLWEFIRDILLNPKHTPSLIKWEDRETGVFRFVQSDTVAAMWGEEKKNTKMTYEKLSRAMRYYYNRGILERVDGRRLVYKFGPNAHGWKNNSKPFPKSSDSCLKQSTDSNKCETPDEVLKTSAASNLCFSYKTTSIDTSTLPSKSPSSSLPSANVLLCRSIRLASA